MAYVKLSSIISGVASRYAGAYGPAQIGGPQSRGETFNWNKGKNLEPYMGLSLVWQLIRILRPEPVSFFLSSRYTAAVAVIQSSVSVLNGKVFIFCLVSLLS